MQGLKENGIKPYEILCKTLGIEKTPVVDVVEPKHLFKFSLSLAEEKQAQPILEMIYESYKNGDNGVINPDLSERLFESAYSFGSKFEHWHLAPDLQEQVLATAVNLFNERITHVAKISADGKPYLPRNMYQELLYQYLPEHQYYVAYILGLASGIVLGGSYQFAYSQGESSKDTLEDDPPLAQANLESLESSKTIDTKLEWFDSPTNLELADLPKVEKSVLSYIESQSVWISQTLVPNPETVSSIEQLQTILETVKQTLGDAWWNRLINIVNTKKNTNNITLMLPYPKTDKNGEKKPYVFPLWSVYEDPFYLKAKELCPQESANAEVYKVASDLALLKLASEVLANDIKSGRIPTVLHKKTLQLLLQNLDYIKEKHSAVDPYIITDLLLISMVQHTDAAYGNGMLKAWECLHIEVIKKQMMSEDTYPIKKAVYYLIGQENTTPDVESVQILIETLIMCKSESRPLELVHYFCINYNHSYPPEIVTDKPDKWFVSSVQTLLLIKKTLEHCGFEINLNLFYANDELLPQLKTDGWETLVELSYLTVSKYLQTNYGVSLQKKTALAKYESISGKNAELLDELQTNPLIVGKENVESIEKVISRVRNSPSTLKYGMTTQQLWELYHTHIADYWISMQLLENIDMLNKPHIYIGMEGPDLSWMFKTNLAGVCPKACVLNFDKSHAENN